MLQTSLRLLLIPALAVLAAACDTSSGTDPNGPSSLCTYAFSKAGATPDYGETCTTNADCQFGTCMLPGMNGNFTNEVFGFCTRGCDCNNAVDSALSAEEKATAICFYPGGCAVGQSQGAWRHAIVKCQTVADCKALDARWTDCREPACGNPTKVCHADAP